jgi:coenzyme F420 hydrogenase subunit delta
VGTSAREVLFDIVLSERKPDTIIIVDAMECNREPGTVAEVSLDSILDNKISDFSIHQVPTSNLLKELRDHCHINVILVILQPCEIPPEVKPGLSSAAQQAIKKAADHVISIVRTI